MTGKVQSLPDGNTEVASIAEVNVVGLLAQMGGRMIQEVSNQMFAQFTANFTARLQQERSPSTTAQAGGEDLSLRIRGQIPLFLLCWLQTDL